MLGCDFEKKKWQRGMSGMMMMMIKLTTTTVMMNDDDSKNLKAVERAVILDEEVLLFTYREVVAKLQCSVFNIFYYREVSVQLSTDVW